MSTNEKKNKFIPKGDTATVVSAFIVVSGVVLTALQVPFSEILLGAGIGYLFKSVTTQ